MDSGSLLTTVFCFGPPAVSAILAILFLRTARSWPRKSIDAKLRDRLTVFFASVATQWCLTILTMYFPQIVVWVSGLQYGLFLAVQLLLYHFLYVLTADTGDRPFPLWHYIFPVFIFLLVTVLALQTLPQSGPVAPVNGRPVGYAELYGDFSGRGTSRLFHFLMEARPRLIVRFVFSTIYTVLAFRRILRYRKKVVDFTADAGNGSPGWLTFFIALSIPLLVTPVIAALSHTHSTANPLWGILPAVCVFIQIPVLCYHMVTGRYVIMALAKRPEEADTPVKIGRQELERYMAAAKPYLKSDLQITDLAAALKTNRSYLSSLINNAYGMNFSQFINGYRLSELDALLADPKNSPKSNLELIVKAGFGSYHSYYRAKKQQDKRNLLML